jgi:hypothetical protein
MFMWGSDLKGLTRSPLALIPAKIAAYTAAALNAANITIEEISP